MKFLADVNILQSLIIHLIDAGHDVLDIKKQALNLKDTELIQIAEEEKRIILTKDKDFIALTQFPKYQVPTITIRLKNQNSHYIKDHLTQFLQNQSEEIINTSLTIIREDSAVLHPYNSSL
jgi:predicted nuclease of predicted toxin-antitoxin system